MNKISRLGMMLIVSGPSGSGKSTIAHRILETFDGIEFSVSCTTRAKRGGETDGRDYHFMTRSEFDGHVAACDFLEHATVHGNSYGTLKSEVLKRLEAGIDVLLDIDVQGASQLRRSCGNDRALSKCLESVFVTPPGFAELERRLRGRGTESDEVIAERLENARVEMSRRGEYGYLLINDRLEDAVSDFVSLVRTLRSATKRILEDHLEND